MFPPLHPPIHLPLTFPTQMIQIDYLDFFPTVYNLFKCWMKSRACWKLLDFNFIRSSWCWICRHRWERYGKNYRIHTCARTQTHTHEHTKKKGGKGREWKRRDNTLRQNMNFIRFFSFIFVQTDDIYHNVDKYSVIITVIAVVVSYRFYGTFGLNFNWIYRFAQLNMYFVFFLSFLFSTVHILVSCLVIVFILPPSSPSLSLPLALSLSLFHTHSSLTCLTHTSWSYLDKDYYKWGTEWKYIDLIAKLMAWKNIYTYVE